MLENLKVSRIGIFASTLPNLLMLGLDCLFAIHMRLSLGGWPSGEGIDGFSTALVVDGTITVYYCTALILATIFIGPFALLLCILVSRWRRFVPYFILYGLVFTVCIVIANLLPEGYMRWWRGEFL
jgi:hypothetical protein